MLSSSVADAIAEVGADRIASAVARLDGWLESMRGPGGYGGPIPHWWESCLLYCGPMIDWRYEGIICGYVTLFTATGAKQWLERACRAADDVLAAQLPDGTYRNSSFQYGPIEGGTPHEAGVDVGLFELARLLREIGDARWNAYFAAAERNLKEYLIGRLWSGTGFMEQPWDSTLVPNKNATVIEALLLYEELTAQSMRDYLQPAANVILHALDRRGIYAGASRHTGTGQFRLRIPIYTARTTCGLIRLHARHPDLAPAAPIQAALGFLARQITAQGIPMGYQEDGTPINCPTWIAAGGDLLRAAILGEEQGFAQPGMLVALSEMLLRQQLPSGGLPTALGFATRGATHHPKGPPELRDLIPAVGWCDKTLRGLALLYGKREPRHIQPACVWRACTWKGRPYHFYEDRTQIRLDDAHGRTRYLWRKGSTWAEIYQL